jgi:nucleotide-binding universal stress UspA family protein
LLAKALARVEAAGIPADTVLIDGLQGRLYEFVAGEASKWNADLIVLGTHGRRGIERVMLGSDAENILRNSTIPVLLIRTVAGQMPAQPVAPEEHAQSAVRGARLRMMRTAPAA